MRKEIGSILLIVGIVAIMLSIAYCIEGEEPGMMKNMYEDEGNVIIALYLFATGVIICVISIIISVRQKPDRKQFFLIPIEYFNKTIAGFTITRLLASVLLIWALVDHEYAYYTILRFVIFGTTSYGIFLAIRFHRIGWAWILGIITILYNPFIPIHLERDMWGIVNICTSILLVVSIFLFRDAESNE